VGINAKEIFLQKLLNNTTFLSQRTGWGIQ